MFKETPSALDALMIRSDTQALSNWSLNNDLGHPCLLTTEWKPVPLAQLIKLVAEYVNPIFVILSTTAAPTRRNKKIRKLWGLWGQQLRRSGPKTWTTRRCGSRQLLLRQYKTHFLFYCANLSGSKPAASIHSPPCIVFTKLDSNIQGSRETHDHLARRHLQPPGRKPEVTSAIMVTASEILENRIKYFTSPNLY